LQNIKNMIGNFGAIHVGIMHAKLQASSFTDVGGEWGDGRMCDIAPNPYTKFLKSPLHFGGIIKKVFERKASPPQLFFPIFYCQGHAPTPPEWQDRC